MKMRYECGVVGLSVNTSFDLNKFIDQYVNFNSGITLFNIILIVFLLIVVFYFIAKSGFISGLREHSEYKRKKLKYSIEDQEELLKDESLKDLRPHLEYHLKVSKLSNYLKFKDSDVDLLKYIIACKDKNKAMKLYLTGSNCLVNENGIFRLKDGLTNESIKKSVTKGNIIYFLISGIGAAPLLVLLFIPIFYLELRDLIYTKLLWPSIGFFALFLFAAVLNLWKYLKPDAAKDFLELEKIKQNEQLDLDF